VDARRRQAHQGLEERPGPNRCRPSIFGARRWGVSDEHELASAIRDLADEVRKLRKVKERGVQLAEEIEERRARLYRDYP
jgi:hypothetical protein